MRDRATTVVWIVMGLAAGLFCLQTWLAGTDVLLIRYVVGVLAIGGAAWGTMRVMGTGWRAVNGPAPEPVVIALAALMALSLWAAAWWLMDLTNFALDRWIGALPLPTPITDVSDSVVGVDLGPVTYELEILFAVVLLPLVEGWLLWGLLQPACGALFGRRDAVVATGLLASLFLTLSAVQDVAPALPWGLASWGGYLVVGLGAALAVYLTGSWWTGVAAHGAYAYASFAWRDDLFREFVGKEYHDPAWLTVIVLGLVGAAVMAQAIRFRAPRPAEPEAAASPRQGMLVGGWLVVGAVVLVIADVIVRT